MTKAADDLEASVRARLTRLARAGGHDFQLTLIRYANERLLYRIAASRHAAGFVLKGATLFAVWAGHPHRPTRDLDLLAFGHPSEERLRQVFTEVGAVFGKDAGDVDAATSSGHPGLSEAVSKPGDPRLIDPGLEVRGRSIAPD